VIGEIMPRTYDDISHLRQPYSRVRLGGAPDDARALGVYMVDGPVDARPLPVHRGYGVYEGMRSLGGIVPFTPIVQPGASYQELSLADAAAAQAWLAARSVFLPDNPSPDVRTPGSVYVLIADGDPGPGYTAAGSGAAWLANELAKGRLVALANAGWDPTIVNVVASVDPAQAGAQAAPGGTWAVMAKPMFAPVVATTPTTCDQIGQSGNWPNCSPWPDVRVGPKSNLTVPVTTGDVLPGEVPPLTLPGQVTVPPQVVVNAQIPSVYVALGVGVIGVGVGVLVALAMRGQQRRVRGAV